MNLPRRIKETKLDKGTMQQLLNALVLVTVFTVPAQQNKTFFKLLPSSQTGINFNNQLLESDTLNILNQANIYNGGGIGIGDFNKDGLMGIYFAAKMGSSKLHLNKGNLQFDDITDVAKVDGQGHCCTGVSVVDINADGPPDMYVSASFTNDPKLRTNFLYINKVTDKKGPIISFK